MCHNVTFIEKFIFYYAELDFVIHPHVVNLTVTHLSRNM